MGFESDLLAQDISHLDFHWFYYGVGGLLGLALKAALYIRV